MATDREPAQRAYDRRIPFRPHAFFKNREARQ